MTSLTNEKKRHHYVPVSYLARFVDDSGKIYAYPKERGAKPLHMRPAEIAFERYYYSQPLPDGGQDNNRLEDLFSEVEAAWPPIVDRLQSGDDVTANFDRILTYIGLMRVRVPAARDLAENVLAEQVKATTRLMADKGMLPPPPEGFPDILDHISVAIDPHQSLHAMPPMLLGFGRVAAVLGFQVLHNTASADFLTSDNPVIYYDPDVAETQLRPYTVLPGSRRIELLFPVTPRILIRGHSDALPRFASQGFRHVKLGSLQEVERINKLICLFGYRFVFGKSAGYESLVGDYADRSPVAAATVAAEAGARYVLHAHTFGSRRKKTKWVRRQK